MFEERKKERKEPRFEDFETYVMEEFMTEAREDGKQGVKRRRTDEDKALPSARHELWDDEPQVEAQEQTITTSIPMGFEKTSRTDRYDHSSLNRIIFYRSKRIIRLNTYIHLSIKLVSVP